MRWPAVLIPFATCLVAAADPIPPGAATSDDKIIATLIDALKDTDPDVRQNLGAALTKFGPSAVEPLVKALASDTPGRRAGAAYALGQLGNQARPALPKLLELLTDNDVDVRRQSSFAVSRILPTRLNATPPVAPGKKE